MTEPSHQKPSIENLELNKETLTDLTESETEAVQGGLAGVPIATNCGTDTDTQKH